MSARIAKTAIFAFSLAIMMMPATLSAQFGGGGGFGGGGNNGGGFGGGGVGNQVGGVRIDADGVISVTTDQMDASVRAAIDDAMKQTSKRLGNASKLRMISLKKLEAAIVKAKNSGQPMPLDMMFLGGLQRIEFLVVSPENNDIILGGPAEPLKVTASGEVVGKQSGLAAIRLEDLIIALQSAEKARTGAGVSVSINPTEEGVRKFSQITRQINNRFHPSMQGQIEQALGHQKVSLTGIPTDSRFAHVMVAADYKMKRLSMGFDQAPIDNFPSLLEMAKRAKVSNLKVNPRFWMECNYQPLAKTDDNLVWQIKGSGVKTLTENDRYDADGKARATGKQNRLAKKWADMMTERFDELAAADPVFRDLQNLMDLSVIAAIIRKYEMNEQVGLDMPTLLGQTQTVSLDAGPTPTRVPTKLSMVRISNSWLIATSGGVQFDSWGVIEKPEVDNQLVAKVGTVATASENWYWDAK